MTENYGTGADSIRARQAEEAMYEQVATEMAARQIKKGLWAKALSLSDGSVERAKPLYIKLRVQALMDEAVLKAQQERPQPRAVEMPERQPVRREAAAALGDSKDNGATEKLAPSVEKPHAAEIERKATGVSAPVNSDTPKTDTSLGVIAGRHILGLALFALASPVVWHGEGFAGWLSMLVVALVIAAVITGVLSLFFTKRAKARGARGMTGSFFVTAWVLLGLGILGQWQSVSRPDASQQQQTRQDTAPARAAKTQPAPALANIDAPVNEYGSTELMIAANGGDVEEVKRLLAAGAKVNVANNDGYTALMFAALNGVDTARLLIEKGADVNVTNKRGYTALIAAALTGHTDIARLLIEKGANVNAATEEGNTALMQAALKGHTETARLLIEQGAQVNAVSNVGFTALIVAALDGRTDTARLLIEKGADVNAANMSGYTALIEAAVKGHTDAVRLFIEKGADVNAVTKSGFTALDAAKAQGYTSIVQMLHAAGASE